MSNLALALMIAIGSADGGASLEIGVGLQQYTGVKWIGLRGETIAAHEDKFWFLDSNTGVALDLLGRLGEKPIELGGTLGVAFVNARLQSNRYGYMVRSVGVEPAVWISRLLGEKKSLAIGFRQALGLLIGGGVQVDLRPQLLFTIAAKLAKAKFVLSLMAGPEIPLSYIGSKGREYASELERIGYGSVLSVRAIGLSTALALGFRFGIR